MKKRNVLAIDLGASNGRAVLGKYDGSSVEFAEIHRFENGAVRTGKGVYWDVIRLYREMLNALAACKKQNISLDAVAVDSWAQDYALLNAEGDVLGAVRSYRDDCTLRVADELERRIPERELFGIAGMRNVTISTLHQLLYDSIYRKGLFDSARTLLHVPSLMIYLLCGEIVCDPTIPSMGGLMDIKTRRISTEVADRIGAGGLMPVLTEPGTVIGKTGKAIEEESGYRGIPVVLAGGHDTSTAIASIPSEEDFLYLSSGTCSMLGFTAGEAVLGGAAFDGAVINMLSTDGRNAVTKGASGLYIVQQCVREWKRGGMDYSYAELAEFARENGVFVSVDPEGIDSSAPAAPQVAERYRERAGKEGTPPEQYAALLGGLGQIYAREIAGMERAAGRSFGELYVVGGGANILALNRLIEKLTGKRVKAGSYEATAAGNVLTQLIALGEFGTWKEARMMTRRFFETKRG